MEDMQALNYCEIFHQIRTELTNYHQKTRKISSFAFLSGNVESIKNMAEGVVNVLLEHGLVQIDQPEDDNSALRFLTKPAPGANVDQMRGILMYFVLNSANEGYNQDGGLSKLGRVNQHCVHLLKQLPEPMPPLLTMAMILNCGLEQQLMEFLACGPLWLTRQYYEGLNDVISQLIRNKFVSLSLVGSTLSAVTNAICNYDQAGQRAPGVEMNIIQNALQLIQHHILDAEKTLGPRSNAHKRFLGTATRLMLDNLLAVLRAPKMLPALPDYFAVYALRAPHLKSRIRTEPMLDRNESLCYFAAKMMDAVERLLMTISVDVYMYWHELPSGQLLFNLQGHICNLSKELLELLSEADEKLQNHSLRISLNNFSEGAESFEQRLKNLSLGELLGFLDGDMGAVNDTQLLAGLEQLQERPISFSNYECVEAMFKHVHLLQPVHAVRIMEHLAQFMQAKQEVNYRNTQPEDDQEDEVNADNYLYADLLRLVLMPIFHACTDVDVKLKLLETRDRLKLADYYTFEQQGVNAHRVKFFNNLRSDILKFPLLEFLNLCYEVPSQTWLSLAQLGMSHIDYAKLYFHVAVRCTSHAMHHVAYTVRNLMQDDRLLCQRPLAIHMDMLLKLYEHPVILNGMNYRLITKRSPTRTVRVRKLFLNIVDDGLAYTSSQLYLAQTNYLQSLVSGMEKCVEFKQYAALDRLLVTLLKLESVEDRLNNCSRRSVQYYRKLLKMSEGDELVSRKLNLANAYSHINGKLTMWRLNNWSLVAQLIRTMEFLRGEPGCYNVSRVRVLDRIMEYYMKNVQFSKFLSLNLRQNIRQLTGHLRHKHLWKDGHLRMLLTRNPGQAKECARLLTMASTAEAIKLLQESMRYGIDTEIMIDLFTAMNTLDSPNSMKVYSSCFHIYMAVFNNYFISRADPSDYPYLVDHLMQTPKILAPSFLWIAADNLSILLNITKLSVLSLEDKLG